MTAAVSPSTKRSTAAGLSRGRKLTSKGVRGNPYHFSKAPQVTAPAAAVLPCQPCSSATAFPCPWILNGCDVVVTSTSSSWKYAFSELVIVTGSSNVPVSLLAMMLTAPIYPSLSGDVILLSSLSRRLDLYNSYTSRGTTSLVLSPDWTITVLLFPSTVMDVGGFPLVAFLSSISFMMVVTISAAIGVPTASSV